MLDDKKTYAPFTLFEYDHKPGHYCLMLSDNHMVGDVGNVFEENGRYGNGYGWTDLAIGIIRVADPGLESRMDFDPEAGTFVAYSGDLEALKKLGALLHGHYHNHSKLGPAVASAPWEWD